MGMSLEIWQQYCNAFGLYRAGVGEPAHANPPST